MFKKIFSVIPQRLLNQLYTYGSLHNHPGGIEFSLKNRLTEAKIKSLKSLKLDGHPIAPDKIKIQSDRGAELNPQAITAQNPLLFPLGQSVTFFIEHPPLSLDNHHIEVIFDAQSFGKLTIKVEDAPKEKAPESLRIPRNIADDYGMDIIRERQEFVEKYSKKPLKHINHFNFEGHAIQGNCENFTGVAMVPMGFVGPVLVNGEHAQGEFIVPMATTEGTLVASYNRGISLMNRCGGIKCTVVEDMMQRAPVWVLDDARAASHLSHWLQKHLPQLRKAAEATTQHGKLLHLDTYLAHRMVYVRFNFSTGDAAGQNMVSRATLAASNWVLENYQDHPIRHFYLEANMATDKKASQINILNTRGKRVIAEAVLQRDLLKERLRVEPEQLMFHAGVANVGAYFAGVNNNGLHSANGLTAMFIATGQDVANIAESSVANIYSEITPEGDLYASITLPSLIVASYGGGTGLPTQRECLEIMDAYGPNKVLHLAEIMAAVVYAGEMSLAAAISASDWVDSHEQYGRNR